MGLYIILLAVHWQGGFGGVMWCFFEGHMLGSGLDFLDVLNFLCILDILDFLHFVFCLVVRSTSFH